MDRKKYTNHHNSGKHSNSRLSHLIEQAKAPHSASSVHAQLEGCFFHEEELVLFVTTLLTQRDLSFPKAQHLATIINSSEKLKHTVKNTFIGKGKEIMNFLITTCLKEEARNIEAFLEAGE